MREQMKATHRLMSAMFVESCFTQVDTLHSSLRTMPWSFSPAVFFSWLLEFLFIFKLYRRKTLPWFCFPTSVHNETSQNVVRDAGSEPWLREKHLLVRDSCFPSFSYLIVETVEGCKTWALMVDWECVCPIDYPSSPCRVLWKVLGGCSCGLDPKDLRDQEMKEGMLSAHFRTFYCMLAVHCWIVIWTHFLKVYS